MSDTVQTRDTPVIRLHPADNVAIAVRRLPTGAAVANDVAAREPIPSGHKVAVAPIAAGEAVRRYGQVIGAATQPIPAGRPCACPQSGDVAIARRTRVA